MLIFKQKCHPLEICYMAVENGWTWSIYWWFGIWVHFFFRTDWGVFHHHWSMISLMLQHVPTRYKPYNSWFLIYPLVMRKTVRHGKKTFLIGKPSIYFYGPWLPWLYFDAPILNPKRIPGFFFIQTPSGQTNRFSTANHHAKTPITNAKTFKIT